MAVVTLRIWRVDAIDMAGNQPSLPIRSGKAGCAGVAEAGGVEVNAFIGDPERGWRGVGSDLARSALGRRSIGSAPRALAGREGQRSARLIRCMVRLPP